MRELLEGIWAIFTGWFLIVLVILVVTALLSGCMQGPQLVTAQRKPARTVQWCEVSGGQKRCKQVSQDEMRQAIEVLGGQRL